MENEVKIKTCLILLASGSGLRFGGHVPKQFSKIKGRMLIEYTLDACLAATKVDSVIVVVSENYKPLMVDVLRRRKDSKPVQIVVGGDTRQESVFNGVSAIGSETDYVLIHNAVQPFVTPKTLDACVAALYTYEAVTVASPSIYTVLEINENREIANIVDRSHSVNDLGPECFRVPFLKKVFEIVKDRMFFTNVTGMVVKNKLGKVYVVDGDPDNIKITYQNDLILARMIIESRAGNYF